MSQTLSLQAFVNTFIYFFIVFKKLNIIYLQPFLPLLDHALELVALVLLANAFLYPIIKDRKILRKKIFRNLFFVAILIFVVEVFWLIAHYRHPELLFNQYYGFAIFLLLELLILASPIYYLYFTEEKIRYKHVIFHAFILYAVAPLVSLINFIVFNSTGDKLNVFIQPWPFLSAMMFTRVIYLKLVDKLFLRNKLRESNLKYLHEKELNELKDDFVSVVSHELRTPLTSIKLYVSMMKKGQLGKTNKQQTDALTVVNEETDRLTNLINDILDLNKLESDKAHLCLTKFDLHELNNPIFFALARKKKLQVKFNIPKNAKVTTDPDKLKQVYINLMNNSAKFTDKGRILVTCNINSKTWQLIIKDTGKGIDKEHLPKLFEKFYQISGHHMTRVAKGTGLGLAIVKKIVDLHNGNIKIDSEISKGTTFTLTFPKL